MLLVHSYVTKCTFCLSLKESMSPSGLSGFSVPLQWIFVYCILLGGAMVPMHMSTSLIVISTIVLGLSVLKAWAILLVLFEFQCRFQG